MTQQVNPEAQQRLARMLRERELPVKEDGLSGEEVVERYVEVCIGRWFYHTTLAERALTAIEDAAERRDWDAIEEALDTVGIPVACVEGAMVVGLHIGEGVEVPVEAEDILALAEET